jgi:hypothetical protein
MQLLPAETLSFMHSPLRIEVHSFRGDGAHRLIGSCFASINELVAASGRALFHFVPSYVACFVAEVSNRTSKSVG